FGFHRSDLDRDGGKIVTQSTDAFGKIIATNEFWMFAGDEKELSKTRNRQMARFLYHFVDRKSDAQNWILAGKSAVTATVDAFIGKIERGEEPHGSAKILTGERACPPGQTIKLGIVFGRNQRRKRANRLAFFQRQIVQYRCESHDYTFHPRGVSANNACVAQPSNASPARIYGAGGHLACRLLELDRKSFGRMPKGATKMVALPFSRACAVHELSGGASSASPASQ